MIVVETSPERQAEKTYIAEILLGRLLGLSYRMQWRPKAKEYTIMAPGGQFLTMPDLFFSQNAHSSYWNNAANIPSTVQYSNDSPNWASLWGQARIRKESPQHLHIESDLFAAAFFMLTRWEERALPHRDAYGRFPASASLSAQNGLLDRPLVHEWAELIGQCLRQSGYRLPEILPSKTEIELSCDVDHPRLWERPWRRLRTIGGSLLRPQPLQNALFWLKRNPNAPADPYDTFDTLMDWAERRNGQMTFHFLGERPKRQDCWYDLNDPYVREVMRRIDRRSHQIGFHPSREAALDEQQFSIELAGLRRVSPQPVQEARWHYLCFSAPETWTMLEKHGFNTDATAGYPDGEGFRTGMCLPFPVFDVENSRALNLIERPLIAMDVTLAQYRRYSPEQMRRRLDVLLAQCRQHRGQLTLLWHNSSLHTAYWRPYWLALERWGC